MINIDMCSQTFLLLSNHLYFADELIKPNFKHMDFMALFLARGVL